MVKELYDYGVHFVVSEANLKYKRPCLYGDKLTIKTSLEFTRSPRTIVTQYVFKNGSSQPAVAGVIELVLVGKDGKPTEVPGFMLDLIRNNKG